METPKSRPAIWAVDPFAEDSALQKRTADALRIFTAGSETPIEPVSIVRHTDRYVLGDALATLEEIRSEAVIRTESFRKELELPRATPPTVLTHEDPFLGNAVKRLLDYAYARNAELIAVGTQARRGITRFLMGSFTETLVLQSKVPCLVVSPETRLANRFDQIVFPTELDSAALGIFFDVLAQARRLDVPVEIFHLTSYDTQGKESLRPTSAAYYEIFRADVTRRETEADALLQAARNGGVRAKLVVKNRGPSVAESVLGFAEELPSTLIAVASRTHRISTIALGSVTRQVIRHALCPVWIMHPKEEKSSK